ncbi:MAG: TIGR04076 family protein [Chloroflexota bacterium]
MPRRKRYDIAVKVISQKGSCDAGHKVGDEWLISSKTPEGICLSAFNALLPNTRVLMFGGAFPWYREPISKVACPDAANPVVFELRRVEKKD